MNVSIANEGSLAASRPVSQGILTVRRYMPAPGVLIHLAVPLGERGLGTSRTRQGPMSTTPAMVTIMAGVASGNPKVVAAAGE